MNKTQKIVGELMKASSFNNFDGKKVVEDLEKSDKWISFIWGRFDYFQLIPLRDIADNQYNADTLYIMVKKENRDWMEKMARIWNVDECDELKEEELFNKLGASPEPDRSYYRLWWD